MMIENVINVSIFVFGGGVEGRLAPEEVLDCVTSGAWMPLVARESVDSPMVYVGACLCWEHLH